MRVRPTLRKRHPSERFGLVAPPLEDRIDETGRHRDQLEALGRDPIHRTEATICRTYGGDLVSTWSILRQSRKPRSPVGLVKQPGTNVSADNDHALALAA